MLAQFVLLWTFFLAPLLNATETASRLAVKKVVEESRTGSFDSPFLQVISSYRPNSDPNSNQNAANAITSMPVERRDSANNRKLDSPLHHLLDLVSEGDGNEHYELIKLVGKGSSGRVYKARFRDGSRFNQSISQSVVVPAMDEESIDRAQSFERSVVGHYGEDEKGRTASYSTRFVAIKVVLLEHGKLNRIVKELRILRQAGKHPNLTRFISAHMSDDKRAVWIALGWIEGANLGHIVDARTRSSLQASHQRRKPAYSAEEVCRMAKRLFVAVAHLHLLGATHGDIDVSNVMLSNGVPVLIDVGDGMYDGRLMGMDILMLTYALIECSVVPSTRHAAIIDDGPINLKAYADDRREAIRRVIYEVAAGDFDIPDGLRAFVRWVQRHVRDETQATEALKHVYLLSQ